MKTTITFSRKPNLTEIGEALFAATKAMEPVKHAKANPDCKGCRHEHKVPCPLQFSDDPCPPPEPVKHAKAKKEKKPTRTRQINPIVETLLRQQGADEIWTEDEYENRDKKTDKRNRWECLWGSDPKLEPGVDLEAGLATLKNAVENGSPFFGGRSDEGWFKAWFDEKNGILGIALFDMHDRMFKGITSINNFTLKGRWIGTSVYQSDETQPEPVKPAKAKKEKKPKPEKYEDRLAAWMEKSKAAKPIPLPVERREQTVFAFS